MRALGVLLTLQALALGCAAEGVDHHAHAPLDDEPIGAWQVGLTLGDLRHGCSTRGTQAVSAQLIDEMLCLTDGAMVRVEHPNITLTSSRVHPYLSPEGRDRLRRAADRTPIQINSAFRTLAEQYSLWRGCPVAATPGRSNHETGRAIDVARWSSVDGVLQDEGFSHPLPESDPVHYEAPGDDLRYYSVLAFQRLWNANHPGDRIAEDGVTGPETLSRLAQTPTEGFALDGPCGRCEPEEIACDGEDDDCDGDVDEGITNACGTCGLPPEEVCNGADDDCDGDIDEVGCDGPGEPGEEPGDEETTGDETETPAPTLDGGTSPSGPSPPSIEEDAASSASTLEGGCAVSPATGRSSSVPLVLLFGLGWLLTRRRPA